VKVGDLVRSNNYDRGLGLFIGWRTFDEKTNPYICPEVWWVNINKITTIQTDLLEVISESR